MTGNATAQKTKARHKLAGELRTPDVNVMSDYSKAADKTAPRGA